MINIRMSSISPILVVLLFFMAGTINASADVPPSFAALVKKAAPGVVNIMATKVIKAPAEEQMPFGPDHPFKDFFDHFFGDRMPRQFRQGALGSGFIIDAEGMILTNNHVVEDVTEIKVKLSDDREFKAEIVGRDPKTDIALIRIETGKALPFLPLGDSDGLAVGDWVVAIGNPFGLGNTVTSGIVSAKYRRIGAGAYDNFIQTDAPINPGNSGGPLLNMQGKVVGINSAIFSQSGGNVIVSFDGKPVRSSRELPLLVAATPIGKKVMVEIIRKGNKMRLQARTEELEEEAQPSESEDEEVKLGLRLQALTPELARTYDLGHTQGLLIVQVAQGSPAAEAGLQPGDIVVEADQQSVREVAAFKRIISRHANDDTLLLLVDRGGHKVFVTLKLT